MNPYNQPYGQPYIPPPRETAVITRPLKTVFLVCIFIIWALALLLPAYKGSVSVEGFFCFILGWSMLVMNTIAFLAWLANLPFFIAFILFAFGKKRTSAKTAFILSVIAFAFSLGALMVFELPTSPHKSSEEVSLYYGTFVWIFSMAFLALVTFLNMKFFNEEIKKKPPVPPDYQQYYQQPFPQQNYPPFDNPGEPTRRGMGDNF
jgi:hypothetical protein